MRSASVAIVLAGCSFTFVTPPRTSAPPRMRPSCTDSRVAPIVDVVIAGWSAFAVGVTTEEILRCQGDTYVDEECSSTAVLGYMYVVPLVVNTLSAVYGFYVTSKCRERHEQWRSYRRANPDDVYQPTGRLGQSCDTVEGVARCERGLRCEDDRCVVPAPVAGQGEACRPIAGASRGGICPATLHCDHGICVPN